MRVLLDECVDGRLAREITGHDVQTVPRMGWAGKRNGELLNLASGQFDIFITVDQNLPNQQKISHYNMAFVVLIAPSNRLVDLRPLVPQLLSKLERLKSGELVEIA
ncbi:MAG TPA: DUF5615 family PIN-like protein [Lacipirellulaceae bacterium]|nr:DUF5615 family PIN-like protein [Lacipirellulaceae bacterium]